MIESTPLRRTDFFLLCLLVILSLAGIVVLRGATRTQPFLEPYAVRQTAWLCIALVVFFVALMIDYHHLETISFGLYAIHVGALIYLLIVGHAIKGAKSWIDLGPMNWQPAETMKIATVLVLARLLSMSPDPPRGVVWLIGPAVAVGLPALLIAAQPDLGSASVYAVMFLAMLYFAGARKRLLGGFVLGGIVTAASAYPFLLDYQKKRILTFLSPGSDPLGAGYNIAQSKIALGAGGLFGKGWGLGTQSTMEFLPEHHTDFIFPSLGEQFGLLGCAAVLGIYALIAWRGLGVVTAARDRSGALVVGGMMSIFLAHVAVNLGMVFGFMPVTGLPLPFLSAGGSSLVTNFLLFGVVANVDLRRYVFQPG